MTKLDYEFVTGQLVTWLKNKVNDAGMEGAVVGLSGGIDSSVTSVLCKKAFADNTLGVIMPCFSKQEDAEDAKLVAEKFSIEYISKDLSPILEKFVDVLEGREVSEKENLAVANMKPRLRMITLYYYATKNNYLVIGTDNWSELEVGYFTKYGDGGIDLAPLGKLVKTEVRELAQYLEIPDKIINKAPSAGLWGGQTDEKEMGLSYEILDKYILEGNVSETETKKIENLKKRNQHKVAPIPMPNRKKLLKK